MKCSFHSIKFRGGERTREPVFVRSMVGVTEVDENIRVGAVKEKIETVVIVGAGLTGLATALALHRCVISLYFYILCAISPVCYYRRSLLMCLYLYSI